MYLSSVLILQMKAWLTCYRVQTARSSRLRYFAPEPLVLLTNRFTSVTLLPPPSSCDQLTAPSSLPFRHKRDTDADKSCVGGRSVGRRRFILARQVAGWTESRVFNLYLSSGSQSLVSTIVPTTVPVPFPPSFPLSIVPNLWQSDAARDQVTFSVCNTP
jgi:hypothetical protein